MNTNANKSNEKSEEVKKDSHVLSKDEKNNAKDNFSHTNIDIESIRNINQESLKTQNMLKDLYADF
jgi:hypothetical protein